jgi:glyceraldehyde 3-phosphate dehydrogenase
MTKKIKLGINGFGRIGRLTTRILKEKFSEQVEIVAVNDLTSSHNLAYLYKHDSTYRSLRDNVEVSGNSIVVNGSEIKVLAEKEPNKLAWSDLGVEVVIESTGRFLSEELASLHLQAGAKKVLLSAPAKEISIPTVVQGVNLSSLTSKIKFGEEILRSNNIISNASCTTNCIAPVMKVLQDSFGIKQANAITVHAYTATQMLQDGPSPKDVRDGRAAAVNMIPSKTGAAKAVELVLPELKGKLGLSSLRVPVITGSMIYLIAQVDKNASKEEVNKAFEAAAKKEMLGILDYSSDELVSSDIIGSSYSCVVDSNLTEVSENTVKAILWYDNEWGYSSRLAELVVQAGHEL